MDIDILLLLFYLRELQRKKYGRGRQIALLAKITKNVGFNFRRLALEGFLPHETAAANALYPQMSTSDTRNAALFLTYPPTELCLGLIWARFVVDVYFIQGGKIYCIKRLDNPPPSGYSATVLADLPEDPDNLEGWYKKNSPPRFADRMWGSFETQSKIQIQVGDPLLGDWAPPFLDDLPKGPTAYPCYSVFSDGIFMKLAFALAGCSWSLGKPSDSDFRGEDLPPGNNIAAVLVNGSNKIVAWSVNVADVSPTCHAESVLIRTLLLKQHALPQGCRLYTTLEPCHMCAGLISECCENWVVLYGQKDNSITNNALERKRGSTRQYQLSNAVVAQVTKAWTDFWIEFQVNHLFDDKEPNTLDFLRDDRTKSVFNRFRLLLPSLEQKLYQLPKTMPTRATSETLVGRLGLEMPRGRWSNRPRQNAPSSSVLARLNIDSDRRLAPVPQEETYRLRGFAQEAAITSQCVQLMTNLLNRGLIQFPD